MAQATEITELVDLHNWIIANRETYMNIGFNIKVTDERSSAMLQNLERLQEQKNKAIEMYLYLYDQGAGGEINEPLHFVLQCNTYILKLMGLHFYVPKTHSGVSGIRDNY